MAGKLGPSLSVTALLGLLTGCAVAADITHAERIAPAHHRALQTDSNLLFVDPFEETPSELQSFDGVAVTLEAGIPYELFFEVQDSNGASGFELTFAGELTGEWTVDIFNFDVATEGTYETNIGALGGLTGITTLSFATGSPTSYVFDDGVDPPEVLVRVSGGDGAVGALDYAAVAAVGGSPGPSPTASSEPVDPAAPVAPVAPVAPAPVPQPVATPAGGSFCDFIEADLGGSLFDYQTSCLPLAVIEGSPISNSGRSIAFSSTETGEAQYTLYFSAPDATSLTGDFTIVVTAQLGNGDGSHWDLAIKGDDGGWETKGNLSGVTTGKWTSLEFAFTSANPEEYVDEGVNAAGNPFREFQVRIATDPTVTSGVEVMYVDQIVVFTGSLVAPTPTPVVGATPTPTPVLVATPTPTPVPQAIPTPPVPAGAAFVLKLSGGEITETQMGGGPIAEADSGDVPSNPDTSIGFAATAAQPADYEIYFKSPSTTITGDIDVTFTAQLGNGAVASDWKVEIYNRASATAVGPFEPLGEDNTLAGVTEGAWNSVTKTLSSPTPMNYLEDSSNEILIRLFTDVVGVQILFVDQLVVSVGGSGTATPSPMIPATPAPSSAPVVGGPPAPPTAPVIPPTPAPSTAPVIPPTPPPSTAPVIPPTPAPSTAPVIPPTPAPSTAPAIPPIPVLSTAPVIPPTPATSTAPAIPPSPAPSTAPVIPPTPAPSTAPVIPPSPAPSTAPVIQPSPAPSTAPVIPPTPAPSTAPAIPPSSAPSIAPVITPTPAPSTAPAIPPSPAPSTAPVIPPTPAPSTAPAIPPSPAPSTAPVIPPTPTPSNAPSPAPIPPAPTTAPTFAPVDSGVVQVDLVPCILAAGTPERDVASVASAYLFTEFFKGFWTATQRVQTGIGASTEFDLVDADDPSRGLCNVVFVGVVPTAAQKQQLQDYSRSFKVRIVYFDIADTILDPEVVTRLGMASLFSQQWSLDGPDRVRLADGTTGSIVPVGLTTNPKINNIFNRPVEQNTTLPDGVTIKAVYTDASGTVLTGAGGSSVGIAEYIGADGLEELHCFLGLGWFDTGSWAWGHYIAEWGTKGIFQGERRFYLGAVVDDLFLSTNEWVYDPANDFFGEAFRLTGADLQKYQTSEARFNSQYGASIKTEHAFNGLGILDVVYAGVESPWRSWVGTNADIGLLTKGDPPTGNGVEQITYPDWLSWTFNPAPDEPGMADDIAAGLFGRDDLLARVQADLDAFYWQSHTFSHLSRDNLGLNDCRAEDAGNTQMAILLGLYDSNNYCWRSMTSPGITGLFNPFCLQAGDENLMKCYPGDNTYTLANRNPTTVSLINEDNQFHSLTTNVGTNGYAGMQIVPRFATNVYYNCVTGKCLVDENEKIRRDVCECTNLDPASARAGCSATLCMDGNIESFNNIAEIEDPSNPRPLDTLFRTEAGVTTRYLLTGRRDKYMFHQANVISTTWTSDENDPMYVNPRPTNNPSLLEYWYVRVLAELATYLNTDVFPVQTLKFDDLCHNFYQHEGLDATGAVITVAKDATGDITTITLSGAPNSGAPIPLTVPSSLSTSISAVIGASNLSPQNMETYGSDVTYTLATGTLDTGDLSKPALSELYQIPQATGSATTTTNEALEAQVPALLENAEEVVAENDQVQGEQGFAGPALGG
eukprot:g12054.t1